MGTRRPCALCAACEVRAACAANGHLFPLMPLNSHTCAVWCSRAPVRVCTTYGGRFVCAIWLTAPHIQSHTGWVERDEQEEFAVCSHVYCRLGGCCWGIKSSPIMQNSCECELLCHGGVICHWQLELVVVCLLLAAVVMSESETRSILFFLLCLCRLYIGWLAFISSARVVSVTLVGRDHSLYPKT